VSVLFLNAVYETHSFAAVLLHEDLNTGKLRTVTCSTQEGNRGKWDFYTDRNCFIL